MKIRKFLASAALAFGVVAGTTVVAPVAVAQPAQAYTTTGCYTYYKQNIGTYTWTKWTSCYFDYTWWEESWFGGSHVDGRRDWPTPTYA